MQSVSVGRSPKLLATALVAIVWASCSPEPYHASHAGLSTGAGGGGGAPSTGVAGSGTGTGGSAGDAVAGAAGGLAGDNGSAGAAGMGAAGSSSGAAGAGAAGTGAAGAGTAGAGGDAGASAAGASGSGTAGASTGTAGTGAAGMGAAGTGAAGATPPPSPLALPMTVSDHYKPTGGMGDAVVAGSVTIGSDGGACAGAPAAALEGACYTITYKPQPIAAGANSTWAGFYWQYPDNNWGTMQPLTVASGAKDVSFYAKGMAGGESIEFEAGGIQNTVSAATPYTDGFSVTQTFKLTTTWTKYTMSMTGMTYAGGVLGGFAWVASVPNTNTVTFFVTGIVWE
jgi:hypothetical protein